MKLEDIKELTIKGESEYAPVPSSGRGNNPEKIFLKDILESIKPIAIKKPCISIVGSLAVHGESDNDVDLLLTGEYTERDKEAILFRIYRMFADILKVPYDDVSKYVHIHTRDADHPYTSYIPLYEMRLEPITDMDKVEMSIPMKIKGNFEVIAKSKSDRVIAGYANVTVLDTDNDFIPPEALEKGLESLFEDEGHYANVMVVHNNIQVGRIIPEYGAYKTHVDKNGLFIVVKIREKLRYADLVWEKILSGELNAFSIAGEVIEKHTECNKEKCWRVIDEINLYEVSICSLPKNELSRFTVISKSDEKESDVCCNVSIEKSYNNKSDEMENNETNEIEDVELSEYTDFVKQYKKEHPEATFEEIAEEWKKRKKAAKPEKEEEEDDENPEELDETEKENDSEDVEKGLIDVIIKQIKAIMDKADGEVKEELAKVVDMLGDLGRKGYPYPMPSKYPYPTKYPYPSKYPYPKKTEDSEISPDEWTEMIANALDDIYQKIEGFATIEEKNKEIEELRKAINERDDKISALAKRVEVLEKSEEDSSTVVSKEEENEAVKKSLDDVIDIYIDPITGAVSKKEMF